MAATLETLFELETRLQQYIAGNATLLQTDINETKRDLDIAWLIICGALVFFMQAGFAMFEAGTVQPKNVANILFKNMVDCSIAAVCFWLIGFGIAYGDDLTGFIGSTKFATNHIYNGAGGAGVSGVGGGRYAPAKDSDGWEIWFFQWAFSGACATIVAGSMAERTRTEAYFIYSIVLTSVIYPVVVHWGWGNGWLSAWGAFPDSDGNYRPLFRYTEASNGMIDFAGSGIVHMVGGFTGLMGAVIVGPRTGRFLPDGTVVEFTQGNKALQALGTFILWFGWYGFNCGSTLGVSGGSAQVAAKVAFTTTISPSVSCLATVVYSKLVLGHYDITLSLNGILAGLVSITAGCAVVEPWHAAIIGAVGGTIYFAFHFLLQKMRVDDPCDACIVHGVAGVWGLLAPGVFCTDENVQYAGYPNINNSCGRGEQFGVQMVAALCIIAWTLVTSGLLFLTVHLTIGLRANNEAEEMGMDASEHGIQDAYKHVSHVISPDYSRRDPNLGVGRNDTREMTQPHYPPAMGLDGRAWSPHVSNHAPLASVPPMQTVPAVVPQEWYFASRQPDEYSLQQYGSAPYHYAAHDSGPDPSRSGSSSKAGQPISYQAYAHAYAPRDDGGIAPTPQWPATSGTAMPQQSSTSQPGSAEPWNSNPNDQMFDPRNEPGFA